MSVSPIVTDDISSNWKPLQGAPPMLVQPVADLLDAKRSARTGMAATVMMSDKKRGR